MGARLFLNFVTANIASATYATFSWGPFTGPHRLVSATFGGATGFTISQSAGLFVTNDPSTPAAADPFTTPQGWTSIAEPAAGMPAGADELAARHTPFLTGANPPGALYELGIDVDGSAFYLKAVVDNRSIGGHNYAGSIVLETLDTAAVTTEIQPRTQPGDTNLPTPVATSPLGQPPTPPTPLATPHSTPELATPLVRGPEGPTKPPLSTMGPFTIAALDPFESARQAYR